MVIHITLDGNEFSVDVDAEDVPANVLSMFRSWLGVQTGDSEGALNTLTDRLRAQTDALHAAVSGAGGQ